MPRILHKPKALIDKFKRDQAIAARRGVLEEIFNDYYKDRHNIYVINFFRGIFFGLGSVLGGTVVVGLVLWVLSFFVNLPLIGNQAQEAQNSIQSSQQR